VAQLFRVSTPLVSALTREAEKQPEKLEKRRLREQLHEQKKVAIEDSVSDFLKKNRAIVGAHQI